MEKHEDNLDKLLKAELEKEAGEIMEEMDSDESLQDISFPEDLDEKMWSKIQAYEEQQRAYEKLSDADKEAIRLGREVQALRGGEDTKDRLKKDVESDSYIDNVVPIEHGKHETDNKASDDGTNGETEKEAGKKKVKKRKRHWKAYGIVAIVAVLAMMWSMVSIGGTPFFGRVCRHRMRRLRFQTPPLRVACCARCGEILPRLSRRIFALWCGAYVSLCTSRGRRTARRVPAREPCRWLSCRLPYSR